MKLLIGNRDITGFEWDEGNTNKNRLKHNVTTQECEEVFSHKPLIMFFDVDHSSEEDRYKVFGTSIAGRFLTLAVTTRSNKIRVIMARDQSKKERKSFNDVQKELRGEEHD